MHYETVEVPYFPVSIMCCLGSALTEYFNSYCILCNTFTEEENDAMIDSAHEGLLDLCSAIVYLTAGGASVTQQYSSVYQRVYDIVKDINLIQKDILDKYIMTLRNRGVELTT